MEQEIIMDSRHMVSAAEGKHMTKCEMGQELPNIDISPLFLLALQCGRSL